METGGEKFPFWNLIFLLTGAIHQTLTHRPCSGLGFKIQEALDGRIVDGSFHLVQMMCVHSKTD